MIDDVILGVVEAGGEQGACIARIAALCADYPDSVPRTIVSRFCASGLDACNNAAAQIQAGIADLVIGGGVESMSCVRMFSSGWAWWSDPRVMAKTHYVPQGVSADLLASKCGYARDVLDTVAAESHQRAAAAWRQGHFEKSIIPVCDEAGRAAAPRRARSAGDDARLLGSSRTVLQGNGRGRVRCDGHRPLHRGGTRLYMHHAGNSAGIVDGAAAALLGTRRGWDGDGNDYRTGMRAKVKERERMSSKIEDLFSLQGKIALITGASSGIGLHFAHLFSAAGARVALVARRIDTIQASVGEIESTGGKAIGLFMDVTDSKSIAPAFDLAETALGGTVEILVNNSGAMYAAGFLDQDEAEVERIFATNLKGAFLVAQEAARRMSSAGRGSIINVASTAGLRPGGLLSSYGASKAGLTHLTCIMALELAGKGIRVNALCPGNIETDMHKTFQDHGVEERLRKRIPQRRFGRPDDLDGAALLLASDAGRYMTGTVIPVDGGQTLSWM